MTFGRLFNAHQAPYHWLYARIGSQPSESVSTHQADEENESGHHVHAFLLENSLWAPSTFQEVHSGDATTWISPSGQACRLDFIFIPIAWKELQVQSRVNYDIDLAMARNDHFVVSLEVSMLKRQDPTSSLHRCRVDTRKCQDPAAIAQFQNYLQSPPAIAWTCGIGQHAEELVAWIQKGASKIFAPDKTLPRQRYLSAHTWQIVQVRKQLDFMFRHATRQLQKVRRHLFLQRWISAYRTRIGSSVDEPSTDTTTLHIAQRLLTHQALWTLWTRRQLHTSARQASRQDRIDALQQIADRFSYAAMTQNASQVYRALKPLLGQAHRKTQQPFRPIPAVQLASGELAATAETACERWREHFAQPERGQLAATQDLQSILKTTQVVLPNDVPFDFNALPGLADIEAYILRSRRHKSPGIDGLPGDVYRVSAPAFARLLWPILAKMTIRCAEPLRWKGGEVCSLPKTHAPSHAVEKYRSILLADYASKLAHGVTRQKLLPFFQEFRQPMQAGGVPCLSTDMLSLYVQTYAQYTRSCGLSSAAFFVDIRQAFYSICRPFVAQQVVHESELVDFFASNSWSPELFQDFMAEIRAPTALHRAHLSSHMEAQVATTLQATWFQMTGQPSSLTATRAGTRPGDSIADLLFAFLMTRFVRHLEDVFLQAHLSSHFELRWLPPCDLAPEEYTQQTVLDASWVDDLVLLIQASSPSTLVAKVQCAAGLVYDAAVQFGLALNLAKDKTSVVMALRGPTARQTWTRILQDDPKHPQLQFTCRALAEPQSIAILPDYVYLGSLHDHTGSPAADLKRKLLSIQHLRKIMRKGVFKNPKVPMTTRAMIFQSLIMSRLQYNIGAWQQLHMHTARSWQTQLVTLYSQMHPQLARGPGVHNLDIVAGARQVHPMLVIGTNRIRLFDRLMQTEMTPLFAVLQAQSPGEGWLHLVAQDILRVIQYVPLPEVADIAATDDHAKLAQYSFHHPRALSKLANRCNMRYLQLPGNLDYFSQVSEGL